MLEPTLEDIKRRMRRDNPWWENPLKPAVNAEWSKRFYFDRFYDLASNTDVRRAAILMGPRRVGKTVLLLQFVHELIINGAHPNNILYISVDSPVYSGISLERFVDIIESEKSYDKDKRSYFIFDEIQYLKNWEVHLKDLVDAYPNANFIASGSAAAALKLKSQESGAGRFSDFFLPPLTFAEYLNFSGARCKINEEENYDESSQKISYSYSVNDINKLNDDFIDYLNYGGYPEAVLSDKIRQNAEQFVKNDIIDKVLLKDLPALYGIDDIQELNSLFSFIAFNTGQEVNLNSLSQKSGLSKPTISKYISYLENAFLIQKVTRVDGSPKKFQRETAFKLYLTNPSMRAALFSPVKPEETELLGHLAETAIYSQWFHSNNANNIYYARWSDYEIDIVYLQGTALKPLWVVEVKWSDKVTDRPKENLKGCFKWHKDGKINNAIITTKTTEKNISIEGLTIEFIPSSLYCYMVGRNLVRDKKR